MKDREYVSFSDVLTPYLSYFAFIFNVIFMMFFTFFIDIDWNFLFSLFKNTTGFFVLTMPIVFLLIGMLFEPIATNFKNNVIKLKSINTQNKLKRLS